MKKKITVLSISNKLADNKKLTKAEKIYCLKKLHDNLTHSEEFMCLVFSEIFLCKSDKLFFVIPELLSFRPIYEYANENTAWVYENTCYNYPIEKYVGNKKRDINKCIKKLKN